MSEVTAEIVDYEIKLQKLKHEFQAYESSMKTIRTKDTEREKDLTQWERRLKAEERKLNEERRDFKAERERFYKTRELQ